MSKDVGKRFDLIQHPFMIKKLNTHTHTHTQRSPESGLKGTYLNIIKVHVTNLQLIAFSVVKS